ncbi:hypothetical protein MPSEU_000031500 [Mayamaea pseudoterrestris]|nr:hypothetical protein MPSEU_000031500 [Mayamaea pseudoterrestris]
MGVPLDESKPTNSQVLILHQTHLSLPSDAIHAKEAISLTDAPLLSAHDATENCDILAVTLLEHPTSGLRKQCVALMGQFESWHLQKFMRLPHRNDNVTTYSGRRMDSSVALRYVNRGAQPSGRVGNVAPTMETTRIYWEILQKYLSSFDANLKALEPIVKNMALGPTNAVVVMVVNLGQSELLLNFICHARRRNLDLSNVLVFATDLETRDLVANMGVAVYYDEYNYEIMPKEAAKRYADRNFRSMMMAKVFVVHMVLALGYDVLFQDVDLIWYRNPLEYFETTKMEEQKGGNKPFDMYFQDDGNHALYYAPYSANTGFYYVRHNDITMHFFNTFLVSGDNIIATKSHQVALIALLGEHASLYGLRVKVFNRNSDEFPGGHAFNQRKSFMKDLFAKAVNPYIFHMSWTLNKVNKQRYFEQMGEWYYHSQCIGKTVDEILTTAHDGGLFEHCCSAEPLVTCHYRDKPSIIPCKDSPPIDNGQGSWW